MPFLSLKISLEKVKTPGEGYCEGEKDFSAVSSGQLVCDGMCLTIALIGEVFPCYMSMSSVCDIVCMFLLSADWSRVTGGSSIASLRSLFSGFSLQEPCFISVSITEGVCNLPRPCTSKWLFDLCICFSSPYPLFVYPTTVVWVSTSGWPLNRDFYSISISKGGVTATSICLLPCREL